MSTRVEDRKESQVQFLATMRDLTALIWSVMGRCPKHSRFIYQTKICDVATNCYTHLIIANSIYIKTDHDNKQKRGHLLEALGLLNSLEALLDIVIPTLSMDEKNERYINPSNWEKIGNMIIEERQLIIGVLKKIDC